MHLISPRVNFVLFMMLCTFSKANQSALFVYPPACHIVKYGCYPVKYLRVDREDKIVCQREKIS